MSKIVVVLALVFSLNACAVIDDAVNYKTSDRVVSAVSAYCEKAYIDRPVIYRVIKAELDYKGYAVKLSCSPIGN